MVFLQRLNYFLLCSVLCARILQKNLKIFKDFMPLCWFCFGRVQFLCSGWDRAVFWVCAGSRADKHRWFCYCWAALAQSRPFLLSHQSAVGSWGCTTPWEGTEPGQVTPAEQRDVPDHLPSCSAHRAGGKKRKGGCLERWHLCPQVTTKHNGALLCWTPALFMGSGEKIPWLALPVCAALLLPVTLSLPQFKRDFLHLLMQFSPWSHRWGSERACVVLSCQLRLNHPSHTNHTSKNFSFTLRSGGVIF